MAALLYTLPNQYTISVNTTDFTQSWNKFRVRVADAEHYCVYTANPQGTLSIYNYNTRQIQDLPQSEWQAAPPVFFETHSYAFCLTFFNLKSGTKPHIIHPNPEVIKLFNEQRLADGYALLANLNFLNEPGHFALQFAYTDSNDKQHEEKIEFDVVSPKLDTKDDLKVIIQQIRQEYGELVFRYLTLTFQQFEKGKEANNDIIWLSVFKQIIAGYLRAVRFILNQPHNRTYSRVEYMRPDRIKHWTNELTLQYKNDEQRNPSKAHHSYYRTEQLASTIDTVENRFVKYTIERITERLHGLMRKVRGTTSEAEYNHLAQCAKELEIMSRNPLFRTIGRFEGFRQESMVLQQRGGYQQVYRYWLLLQNGLNLIDGDTSVGVQPIWKLYELWCFLRMKRYVMQLLDIDPIARPEDTQLIKDTPTLAFDPFTGGDLSGTASFVNRKNGDVIEVGYQYKFNRDDTNMDIIKSATVEQKPDIVLNIHKADGQTLTYLYDAKYRVLGDDDPNRDYAVQDEPVPDTLNQMHRYRDAIYYGSRQNYNFAKEVIGAYILFPGRFDGVNHTEKDLLQLFNTDRYKELPYYLRSIFEVNVGAFPLLPNENSGLLLRYHLDLILNHRSPLEQIENSVPQRGLQYLLQTENGILLVMMPNYNERCSTFQDGNIAVPLKMTESAMEILENINSIRFILFHHRASQDKLPDERGQHLFRLKKLAKVIKRDIAEKQEQEGKLHLLAHTDDVHRYVEIHFDFEKELPEGVKLNCSSKNLPFAEGNDEGNGKNKYRYYPQYAEMSQLLKP